MNLPNVSSKYGAPMGRRDTVTDPDARVTFRMVRLRWVDGDYDQGGAYWGHVPGDFIYWAKGTDEHEEQEMFVRAKTHEEAKRLVRDRYYRASFYR